MGLDQYLYAKKYHYAYDHADEKQKEAYYNLVKAVGLEGYKTPSSPHLFVKVCVNYWRKANAIHQWFVINCQGGEDDCKEYDIDREKLQELVDTCKEVLKYKGTPQEKEKVEEILPPTDGFFFGSTEVDKYYWEDLEDTVHSLTAILQDERFVGMGFSYESSW